MLDRMDRVAQTIKRHISVILQEEISDPRIEYVTITRVEVTKDLQLAKVFYTMLNEMADKEDVLKGLKNATSFVRKQLAERMSIKFIPKISFREDVKEEKNRSINEIFKMIEKERNKNKE